MTGFFYFIAGLCILAILYRGVENISLLIWNLRWIFQPRKLEQVENKTLNSPKFIICIPALREQTLIKSTIAYFSELDYPKDKLEIYIVTTAKEEFEKEQGRIKVFNLAQDIADKKPISSLKSKYIGIFTQDKLELIYTQLRNKNIETITCKLLEYYDSYPLTKKIAVESADAINSLFPGLVRVVNYPHKEGVMGHQINYLVNLLKKEKTNEEAIFVVYNADSRPNKDTLNYVIKELNYFESVTGKQANIVQQSSLFTVNYNEYKRNAAGYFLKASSLFQTKWTLVREFTRLRQQSKSVLKTKKSFLSIVLNTKLAHCVGHGLSVRLKSLSQKEALPTETMNEDLPFGYYKCCLGESILPLPILENSETPTSIKALTDQKKTWFWPYLEYFKCRKLVLERKEYRNKLEVDLLTAEGMINGLIWFFFSAVFLTPLIIGVLTLNPLLLSAYILALASYWFIPLAIIYLYLPRLEARAGKVVSKLSLNDFALVSLAGLGVIFTHSVGPIRTIFHFLKAKYFGDQLTKLKTER